MTPAYILLRTKKDIEKALNECKEKGILSFDIETSPLERYRKLYEKDFLKSHPTLSKPNLSPHYSTITCITFCCDLDKAWFVPLKMKNCPNLEDMEVQEFWNYFQTSVLINPKVVKIAYNLDFEATFLHKYDLFMDSNVADPMHMQIRYFQCEKPHLLQYPLYKGMGLKSQTELQFGYKMLHYDDVVGTGHFDDLDYTKNPDVLKYACDDSICSLLLYNKYKPLLEQIIIDTDCNGISYNFERPYKNYWEFLNKLEMPTFRAIGMMQYHGMVYNNTRYKKTLDLAAKEKEEALNTVRMIGSRYGIELNPGSNGKTKSVKTFLFKTLGCPVLARTSKLAPCLDSDALVDTIAVIENNLPDINALSDSDKLETCIRQLEDGSVIRYPNQVEILELLYALETIQKISTLVSSHLVGRKKYVNLHDGRIHSKYDMYPRTSRFASSEANLQNIPKSGSNDEYKIRDFYEPAEDHFFLAVDYQAQEVRVGAEIYKDTRMIDMIHNGADMHTHTANHVFGLSLDPLKEKAPKEERDMSKVALFQKMYGGSPYSIRKVYRKKGLHKTIDECITVINGLERAYPGMGGFQDYIWQFAMEKGYVETLAGYRRYLPELKSEVSKEHFSARRQASNTPIQGTAADATKKGMNSVYDALYVTGKYTTDEVKIVGQIHDEVLFEVKAMDLDEVENLVNTIVSCMETPLTKGLTIQQIAEPEIVDVHDVYNVGARNGWSRKIDYKKWVAVIHEIQKTDSLC